MEKNRNDIYSVRENDAERERFIEEHIGFILSCASKILGKYVSRSDDEFSVALIAFDEAINKYDHSKGDFRLFASTVIRSRLIDEHRKKDNNSVPMSSLIRTNSDGNTEEFDIAGDRDVKTDAQIELECFKAELASLGISLFDIPKDSPKAKKTKTEVARVLTYIKNTASARKPILTKGEVPSKQICDETGAKKKLLERHRRYIIAASVALCRDYPVIQSYIGRGEAKQ